MEIPLLSGRALLASDDANSPPVVVVSRTLARQLWGDREPLGESLILLANGRMDSVVEHRVVGVVGDVRSAALPADPAPIVYLPFAQDPQGTAVSFALRSEASALALLEPAREAVRRIDRSTPIYQAQTLEAMVSDLDWAPRLLARILSIFSVIALGLAACGVYSVLSFGVAERRREIGIRLALGSSAASIKSLMVRQTLAPTAMGIGLGLIAAALLAHSFAGQFYNISPWDPGTYVFFAVLLAAVALLASWWPARRAAAVSPATTLEEA